MKCMVWDEQLDMFNKNTHTNIEEKGKQKFSGKNKSLFQGEQKFINSLKFA